MSNVSPSLIRRMAQEAQTKGIGLLDAAVSGIVRVAEAGELTIMVGGKESLFIQCQPIFRAMGKIIFHMGDVGMGMVCKLAKNLIASANIVAATEGLAAGVKAGVKLDKLMEVLIRPYSGMR